MMGVLAAGLAGEAQAQLLAYDPLQTGPGGPAVTGPYTPGTEDAGPNLAGQNPTIGPDTSFYAGAWVASGGDNQAVDHIASLSYPNFPQGRRGQLAESTQFGCCTFGRSGRPFGDVFGTGSNGLAADGNYHVLYGSFLIDFGTVGTNDPMGGNIGKHGFEMWNDTNETAPDSKLVVDLAFNYYTGDPLLFLNVLGTRQNLAGNWTRDALAAINGGTHLVVMKLEFTDGLSEDRVTVYLDPTDSIESNWTPEASIGVPTGGLAIWGHSAFSSFQFDGGGANPGAIDEFRWGETFADVTPFIPEPTSALLAMIGAAGFMLRRRSR
jgi:MprA protease rhombosortase-interaction domain-containing protein